MRPRLARLWPVAGLGAIILVGGAVGFAVSRPPAPPPAPTPIPAPTAPRSAFGYSLATDTARHDVVMFGGVDTYDQTWLWNGRRWTQAHPDTSPAGRFNAPAAYDAGSHEVMMYGGRLADGELAGDTWAWNGVTWHELDSGASGPPAGEGGAMAWDPTLQTMVLVVPIATPAGASGETWLWQGDHWVRATGANFPAGVAPVAEVFDAATSTLFAVGGAGSNPISPGGLLTFVLARWDGAAWDVLPARSLQSFAGIALDPDSRLLLVAAANGFPPTRSTSQAWEWTGTGWRTLTGTSGPPWPEGEVTDCCGGRVLLFASLTSPTQMAPQTIHVWGWDGAHWHRLDSGD